MKSALAAVAVLVFGVTAGAQSLKEVGPLASAAQIIAARGSSNAAVLQLTYVTAEGGRLEATIGPDYVFVRQAGGKDAVRADLIDFRLKRQFALDETAKTFSNVSLYAMADFRVLEIHNRHFLRQMLEKVKPGAVAWSAFYDQQELGLVDPEDGPPAVVHKPTATGGLRLEVEAGLTSAFEPSNEKLSDAETQGLARLLRHSLKIHPDLVAAIVAARTVPREIVILEGALDRRFEQYWQLKSFERTTGAYPLTPAYRSDLPGPVRLADEPLKTVLPLMLEAIAGRAQNGPRSLQWYRAAEAEALAKGNLLQHFLLDNESGLQYRAGMLGCFNGSAVGEDCSKRQDIMDRWMNDGPTMALMQTFPLEHSDPKAAIRQRNAIARSGLINAYMLDLWNGDAILQTGTDGDAAALIALAIKGNPYVGGFYKDLGDTFRYGYSPDKAWLCYDLARLLPGGETAPVVDGLAKLEKSIAARVPELF